MTRHDSLLDLATDFTVRLQNFASLFFDSMYLLYDDFNTLMLIYDNQRDYIFKILFGCKRADLYIIPFFEAGVNFPIALPPDVKFVYPKHKQALA